MPADPVRKFKNLLEQKAINQVAINRMISDLTSQGSRRAALRCARLLRMRGLDNSDSIKAELVNLLSLGKVSRARTLLSHYQGDPRLAETFKWMFERYLNKANLEQEAKTIIKATQQALITSILQTKQRSNYLNKILGFTDYIIVSNSNHLRLTDSDKTILKGLEKPLYIYINIGNPLFLSNRESLYNSETKELVIGGFKNIFTAKGELFFKPWEASQFLGALTRVNPKFLATWHEHLSGPIRRINHPHAIYELDESNLIDAFYPLTLFNTSGTNQRRLCTNGWMSISLFDAIARITNPVARLWSAGFSMSPSYVFESCDDLYFHDYPFEKTGIEIKFANKSLNRIGSTKSKTPEASTGAHLEQAGIKSEKLADFKKRTGKWPKFS